MLTDEARRRVRDALLRLPERYRVALALRYYGELGYDEIAGQLGLTRNHVAILIFRGKQALRRLLADLDERDVTMTCLSELTWAVYVDGELSPEEARDAERHLGECARCRELVAALQGESRAVTVALDELAALAPASAPGTTPASVRVRDERPTGPARGG